MTRISLGSLYIAQLLWQKIYDHAELKSEEGLKVKATLVRARSEESEFTCKNILDLYYPRLLEAFD